MGNRNGARGKERGEEQTGIANRTGKIGARGLVRAVNVVTCPTLSSRHRAEQKEQISIYTGSIANEQIYG